MIIICATDPASYRPTLVCVTDPVALEAALGVLLLVAGHTDYLLVTWDEALASDWLATDLAAETLLVPLLALVLKLLHSCNTMPTMRPTVNQP